MASTSYSPGAPMGATTEFAVRIPKKVSKKYSVMQFNRQTKVDFKEFSQVKMERENNLKEFKAAVGEEMPTYGAGSEFGRERREEARRKKFGLKAQKNYKEEDQPWILKLGGKQGKGKRFKGRKEGLVAENSCYYILKQLPDHSFEAHPVDSFYNFAPMINYRTLNAEEAEEEFGRRDRTMNFFTMMLQRKLKDQPEEGEQEEKPKKQGSKSEQLTITEDDEFQNLLMSDDDSDEDAEDETKEKKTDKNKVQKGGKNKKKKKKVEEDEAEEESDEGDFDARELDYISEESSEEEAEIEEKHDIKGIDQELQKIEDDDQENEENEGEEDKEAKEEGEIDNKDSDSESNRSDSSESDIDDQMQSPFLMQKKPGKKSSNRSSSRSSTGPSSRSNTPTPHDTATTLTDAASRLQKDTDKSKKSDSLSSRLTDKLESKKPKAENGEQRFQAIKRPHSSSTGDHPSAKKVRTESPVPRSQTGTPPSEQGITEDVVRRYLTRKPMQTKDLLHKLNPKKVGLSKEEVVQRLTEVLKRLNPDKIKIKDKTYWTIKSGNQKLTGV